MRWPERGLPFLIHKESAHPRRRRVFLRRRHVFLRRSCMFLRRRGAPFGPPHRVSHKCYAFPRRSCGVSTEMLRVSKVKMRVSTEKLHICMEKRLSVTEQRQYSTEKFDFHGITTHLYGEGASFYGEWLARMGHRRGDMYPPPQPSYCPSSRQFCHPLQCKVPKN